MRSALAIAIVLLFDAAQAQSYPSRPVRVVIGSPAASVIDVLARPIALRMSGMFGQQVIIDNRPGATGAIANELVARAQPDGHTLLASPNSFLVINPHLHSKLPYDSLIDFAPITQISAFPFVLTVHPSVPARDVKMLIALARAKPGALNFASSGAGSAFHLAGEMFKVMARVDIVHVPYKGSPPAVIDLIAGRVDMTFVGLVAVQQHVKAGRLRALAVTGLKRDPLLPGVPTLDESGLRGFEITGGHSFLAPAATPRDIVDRLNAIIIRVLGTPEIRELWASQGMEVVTNMPEQLAAKLREQHAHYGKLIRAAGIKPE